LSLIFSSVKTASIGITFVYIDDVFSKMNYSDTG